MARPGLYANGNPRPDIRAHLEPAVVDGLDALIGRDPRQMMTAELNGIGHEKQPLLRVIRTNCIECVGGSEAEVRRCRMWWCPFWPYRMATNPFHRQELSEAEREARSTRAKANRTAQLKSPRLPAGTGELNPLEPGEASAGSQGADEVANA